MGQHWYTIDGEPCHWITMDNGNKRDTTLRDARKMNLLPSVTAIIGQLDKPALNRWKEKQVLLAAMTLPRIENEPVDKFCERVMQDAFKESTDARDLGSEIHDSIETIWKGKPPSRHQDIAYAAVKSIVDYTETSDFTAELTVAGDGYAGMIDLHNSDFVIDYKTKDIKGGKMAYPEMCMQLAAYDAALNGTPKSRLLNVFVDRTEAGKVVIHEWSREDIGPAWEQFKLLVKLWQLSKNYYPEVAA